MFLTYNLGAKHFITNEPPASATSHLSYPNSAQNITSGRVFRNKVVYIETKIKVNFPLVRCTLSRAILFFGANVRGKAHKFTDLVYFLVGKMQRDFAWLKPVAHTTRKK